MVDKSLTPEEEKLRDAFLANFLEALPSSWSLDVGSTNRILAELIAFTFARTLVGQRDKLT